MAARVDRKELRSFGLIVGGIFAVIGLWPVLFRAQGPRLWALAFAVALVVPPSCCPAA